MSAGGRLDLERDLNPEQRAAVLAPDGPVLVIAAAGTGKTRTLTYRVVSLVERGVLPERMLLLTFTNRAANEMLDRARSLVGTSVGGIWGGTFHHLCNRILRRYADVLEYRHDYTILDSDDSSRLMKACATDLKLKDKLYPKPDVVLSLHSLARNGVRTLEDLALDRFPEGHIAPSDLVRQCSEYETRKRSQNAMDFDDLLVRAVELLEKNESIRARYQEQFLHVLVDEYQDTNPIQARLVDILAAKHRNILVVGDDFQSIYSWRGADFRNFLSFPQRYPDAKVFKLETNYRSVPGVLEVANACIAGNPEQFQKTLKAVRTDATKPMRVEVLNGHQQADYVVQEIQRLLDSGMPASQIAVLYRAHYHALDLELALARSGMKYAITSGVRFFEQAHIKDALALLRLMHNPSDELAFVRLTSMMPRIGEKTAQRVWNKCGGRVVLSDPAQVRALGGAWPEAARDIWKKMAAALEPEPEPFTARSQTPARIIERFCGAFYREYAEANFEEVRSRLEDLDALVDHASKFERIGDLLNEVALLTNVDAQTSAADGRGESGRGGEADDEPKILLSTVHQAKGLEWRVVFVLWLSDGLFPSARAIEETAGGEQEERRLFYVSVTRAKDRLYLCSPKMRSDRSGAMQYYTVSRFVKEIPQQLLQRLSLVSAARGW